MQPQGNFESAKRDNHSLTRDDASINLFGSIMDDFTGKPRQPKGSLLVQNDIPTSFRSDEFEIVDNDEVESPGKPAGDNTGLSGRASDNTKMPFASDELPSMRKPAGATPESRLNSQEGNHRSSTADRAQQNKGVEIEGRIRNERATEEQRTITEDEYGYM